MKQTYLSLRSHLEPVLGVGTLDYLGSTVTSGPNGTGSRGLLELYRVWTEGNVVMAEFRLGVALVATDLAEMVDLQDAKIAALNAAFGGRINTQCLVGTGTIATLKELALSSIEGFSNNATQSSISAVKSFIGASIEVRGLS